MKKINKLMMRNVLVLAFLLSTAAVNAQLPVSTDGTDPKTWDPKLDATISGENNHKIVYEDEYIRVLSVTVKPGEVEKAHHHAWPSVIVYDRPVKSENRDINGHLIPRTGNQAVDKEKPIIIRKPPEAAHAVTNLDDKPLHLIRVEFKKGFPE